MRLIELKNSPHPYTVLAQIDGQSMFRAPTLNLTVEFIRQKAAGNQQKVVIEFTVDGHYHITGSGNAVAVFSTVYNIVKEQLPKFLIPEDYMIFFTAHEPSRVKLYDRFTGIVSQILGPEWKEHHRGKGVYRWVKQPQQLSELQNRPFDYEESSFGKFKSKFNVPELKMEVSFVYYNYNSIDIEFSVGDSFGLSGGGREFAVFSTLANIIKRELPRFLKDHVNTIEFTSSHKEPKRTSFYEKRAVPFISKILGPKWISSSYIDPKLYNDRVFRWTKNTD